MGRISDLVDLIRRNVEVVNDLVMRFGVDGVVDDYVLLNAVLHMLQTSIQALIDIGSIILSQGPGKPPSRYSEVPKVLMEMGVLSNEEATLFRRVIGFRNIVIHQYTALSLDLLRKVLGESLYRDLLRLAIKLYEYSLSKGIDS